MTARNTAKKPAQKTSASQAAAKAADPVPTEPEKPAADPVPTEPEKPAADPVPVSPAPEEAHPSPWSEVTVAAEGAPGLNLRPEKTTDGMPIGSLPNGMAILVGPDEDGWREVKGAGWVLSEFLA
ncbi:SH3 domain-containing protein [uncultured Adlercreutzia sp.]|uniref:SH3 domain-containing protein n=1 Tax=uncultured Adlercreutzia sp. TaxID=875803 RepID=UPI00266BA309|nr:hypothetical protein [uncultured Adlercreutzia sp.]